MFYCGSFKKQEIFNRKGAAKSIIVKPEGDDVFADFSYNPDSNAIEVGAGNNIVVITDKIGLREGATIDVVFAEGGFLVKLLEGILYVKVNENTVKINVEGNGELFNESEKNRVYWVTAEDLKRYAIYRLNKEYNVPTDSDYTAEKYWNNLRFTYTINANDNGVTLTVNCVLAEATIGMDALPILEPPAPKVTHTTYKKKSEDDEEDDDDLDYEDSDSYDEDDDDIDVIEPNEYVEEDFD